MSSLPCSLCAFVSSSIGKKLIVALTGLVLVLFLAGHLAGNLLIFKGPADFNEYAHFLHHMMHGAGVWIARLVLLSCLVLHVWFTILLTRENRAARQSRYACDATVQASKSSKIMIWSGLTILAFIIFHILHYTVRTDAELAALGEVSPWQMVIVGFSNPLVSLFYIVSMTLLCSHLSHGVASIFQTLGLRTQKTESAIALLAKVYALVIYLGFISIPIAILCGFGS
ncbi:MAG: succinate dehydrogenase cytochrome b subunit [Verrucomicrobiales bacterium]